MASQTVVLVDDNRAMVSGVAEMLQNGGVRVAAFHDFESAKSYLQSHAPSALVTDVRLGAYNGLHLVVLAKQWLPRIVAFVYSGYGDQTTRDEARRCGAEYFAKDEILTIMISRLLERLAGSIVSADRSMTGLSDAPRLSP